jgi:hypothetical protein
MRLKRATAALVLASVGACSTLRPVPDYEQYIRTVRPGELWITPRDSRPVKLEGARYISDTLVGFVRGEYREFAPGQVSAVQIRQTAGGKTTVLVGVLAAAGITLLAVLGGSGDPSRMPTPEDPPTSPRLP